MVEYLSSQGFMTHCSYLTERFLFNTVCTTVAAAGLLKRGSSFLAYIKKVFNLFIPKCGKYIKLKQGNTMNVLYLQCKK